MIAFLDASALIYLPESAELFRSRVHDRLSTLADQNAELLLAISRLTGQRVAGLQVEYLNEFWEQLEANGGP